MDDDVFKELEELSFNDEEKSKNQLVKQIHDAAALWPEFIAMFRGMVESAMEDGWEETAARALVLSTVTGAMNVNVIANLKAEADDDAQDSEE